jgi:NADH dehydrogenase
LFDTTLLDAHNYHLFQPLLYQVAAGSMSATEIATPLRMILRPGRVRVVQESVTGVDPTTRVVHTASGTPYPWDVLVLAMGLGHNYFGHDEWARYAPTLKYLNDAFRIRNAVLRALERAETADVASRKRLLRFIVVGGGPTGVELGGALAELTRRTLARDFRSYDPSEAEILVVEAGERILTQYSPRAAASAVAQLARLGVTVLAGTHVQAIDAHGIEVKSAAGIRRIEAANVIWAAGSRATELGLKVAEQLGVSLDRGGRFTVDEQFLVAGHGDVYAIGDIAAYSYRGTPLPGLAPVAEQAGRFVAHRLNGGRRAFRYRSRGQLAVIGRNAAVGEIGGREFSGPLAWWLWLLVHIRSLIGFDVKLKVMVAWTWKFLFDRYEARIISERDLEQQG